MVVANVAKSTLISIDKSICIYMHVYMYTHTIYIWIVLKLSLYFMKQTIYVHYICKLYNCLTYIHTYMYVYMYSEYTYIYTRYCVYFLQSIMQRECIGSVSYN